MGVVAEAGAEAAGRAPARPWCGVRLDVWAALLVGVCVGALYLPTLFPGLGGGGDATKFQYVGRVLGTAHPPGYPTYVLISHLFSYLPVGSLAYRINLMSAFWAAAGAGLMYLILLRLRSPRWVAATVALSMGFGRFYWAYAVHAEVYSLAAAMYAGVVLKVLDWAATRRPRDLYSAVAIAALAVGNHLSIVFIVPALIIYVLVTDARAVLRPRVLAICAAIVVAGLAQYLFIVLRTVQHAPYIEASATNVRELLAVMTARKYAYEMWVFDPTTLLTQRVPALLSLVGVELGLGGALLLLPGAWSLARTRWREALLLAVAFTGMLVVTANVDGDVEGFMVPAFVFAWPAAGVGLSWLASWIARIRRAPVVAIACAGLALLVVLPQPIRNYRVNDHHGRTIETRYFKTLFDMLPARAVIVQDDYSLNQLLLYELLGERAAGTRDIRMLPAEPQPIGDAARRGYRVFGFDNGREALEAVGFRFAPVPLPFDMRSLPLYVMTMASRCEPIGNSGWRDMTALVAGAPRIVLRIDNYTAFEADAVLYLAAARMPSPRLIRADGTGAPRFDVASYSPGGTALRTALRDDGVNEADAAWLLAAPAVCRVSLRVNDEGQWCSMEIDPGGRVDRTIVRARVDRNNPKRALFCGQATF